MVFFIYINRSRDTAPLMPMQRATRRITMDEVKEEVVEVKEEVKEPEVKEEVVETPDPSLDPESGKPWKELAKEYERKYHTTNERFINYQKQPETPADPNEEIPATRAGIKQVLSEQSQQEARAEQLVQNVIEDLSMTNPELKQFAPDIEKQLKQVPAEQRTAALIEATAYAVYGRHKFTNYKTESPKPVKKIVASKSSDVLSPSPKSGNSSEVILTDDEQEYADSHRLATKGYSDEEIREQFQKYSKKK